MYYEIKGVDYSGNNESSIADFFHVEAGATAETLSEETGFFAAIKNFFQTTPDDFHHNLTELGLSHTEIETAKKELDDGKLVIIAHHMA